MTRQLSSRDDLADALGIRFSDEQLDAITSPLEPAVIIAGAGTGKTTVMAARVVWLVGTGQVRPHEVLGLTFTRKAAGELGSRVASALERAGVVGTAEDEGAELVMTYDSFAARLVAEFGLRLGLDSDPVMLTGASRFRLASRAVTAARGPFSSISRLSHQSIPERILELDAQLQSHLVDHDAVRDFTRFARARFEAAPHFRGKPYKDVAVAQAALAERLELLDLVADYQSLKASLGLVEYADQLRRAVDLATTVPAVGRILRERFAVVLLDEYQDTSAAQAILLRSLFSGDEPELGRGFPVTAVGDPHQAIYGWRGAAATNIIGFPAFFPLADGSPAPRLTLTINRRSGQRVLDVGNRLAEPLTGLPGAEGVALVAPPGTPPGHVEAASFDTQAEEFEWIAEAVLARHASGVPWPEIAILVRRNAALAPLYDVLRERDVPAEVVGLGGLLHLAEVAPVVATLRVLDDVASNPDVAALLTGPRWGLGLADLEALGARAREIAGLGAARETTQPDSLEAELEAAVTDADPGEVVSLLDAVANPGEGPLSSAARERLGEFAAELAELRRHVREPVSDLVRRVVAKLGLEVELRTDPQGDPSQLGRFVSAVTDYVDVDGEGSLSGLLAWLDAEDAHGVGLEQAVPSDADSVKLLTVHRAKGLEWDTVFLPALADKVFPAEARSGIWPTRAHTLPSPLRGDAEGIPQLGPYTKQGLDQLKVATQEDHRRSEDRLAYVAATRAKQLLVATTHVWTPGLKRPRPASPYYETIAAASIDGGEPTASHPATNPEPTDQAVASWPVQPDPGVRTALRDAARLVDEASTLLERGASTTDLEAWVWESGTADVGDADLIRGWDVDAALLVEQHERRRARDVVLPEGLSATALMAMRSAPAEFAASLLRPMPRRPAPGARRGSQFHEWVQRRFQVSGTFDELAGVPAPDSTEFQALIRAFEAGQFAHRTPVAVEVPFLLTWAGQVLRGRIDAVYAWDGEDFDHVVVDWKTSEAPADPLQLAVYRQAWARAQGLDPARVGAGFYHVRSDRFQLVPAPAHLIDDAFAVVEDPS